MIKIDSTTTDIIWFDLDDTLIDFTTNSKNALKKLYDESILNRYYPDFDTWYREYYPVNNSLWTDFNAGKISGGFLRSQRFILPLHKAGMSLKEAELIAPDLDTTYLDILANEKQIIPGADTLLKQIKQKGIKTAVLSNGFQNTQQQKLRSTGLDKFIDYIVLSDHIGVTKPDVRLYKYAMEVAQIPDPERHIMIGDNPLTDIKGAVDTGWRAILFDRFNLLEVPHNVEKVTSLTQIPLK